MTAQLLVPKPIMMSNFDITRLITSLGEENVKLEKELVKTMTDGLPVKKLDLTKVMERSIEQANDSNRERTLSTDREKQKRPGFGLSSTFHRQVRNRGAFFSQRTIKREKTFSPGLSIEVIPRPKIQIDQGR